MESPKEYFRDLQRKQLGDTANVFSAFSVATTGMTISILLTDKLKFDTWDFIFFVLGSACLLFSLMKYVYFTVNRLKDFKTTADKLKIYKTVEGQIAARPKVREETSHISEKTKELFELQRVSFIIGFLLTLIGITHTLFVKFNP